MVVKGGLCGGHFIRCESGDYVQGRMSVPHVVLGFLRPLKEKFARLWSIDSPSPFIITYILFVDVYFLSKVIHYTSVQHFCSFNK